MVSIRNAVFGVIEIRSQGLDCHAFSSLWIIVEQLPQMEF